MKTVPETLGSASLPLTRTGPHAHTLVLRKTDSVWLVYTRDFTLWARRKSASHEASGCKILNKRWVSGTSPEEGGQLTVSATAAENETVIKILSKCSYTVSVFSVMVHILTVSIDFEKIDF